MLIPPYSFFFVVGGDDNYKKKTVTFTGRAGGARADDNFTKKPQKKLIRYMILFWGSSTNS